MNIEQIIIEINKQNLIVQKQLSFEEIKNNNLDGIINKILDTNFAKYQKEISKKIDYIKYIEFLTGEIKKLFLEEKELKLENILTFHKKIFSIFSTEELKEMGIKNIGAFRKEGKMVYNLDEKGKLINKNYFISTYKIKKSFIENIKNFNESQKGIYDILLFFQKNISKIHPFENGNGRVFFSLLDILLLKYDYLPLFINQDKKNYNNILNKYYYNYNFKKLIINFLDYTLNKYKNYQIK